MSPWTLLGWILLVLVVLVLSLRLLIVLAEVIEKEAPKIRGSRKRKRALKGKVTCEYLDWENEPLPDQDDLPYYQRKTERVKVTCARPATHSARKYGNTYSYWCAEHAAKQRGNVYPQPMNRPEPTHKTRVVS